MSTLRTVNLQNPSAASPAVVLAADGTATATVSAINNGPLAGMRNAIINGNFDIWQRGTSFTGNQYAADRWQINRNGTTHTTSRQSFTLGQTDVPGEPQYFLRSVVTSVAGSGNYIALIQPLEGVRAFAGQQITVSFWAKADSAKPITLELAQRFGTGGSPSADVTGIGVSKFTLSTAWQKFTKTINVPSIAGKTFGTGGNDRLDVIFWFDAGSSFNARTDTLGQQSGTFDIAQVQVEAGPVATPFERRPIGVELGLCQRYFWTSGMGQGYPLIAGQAFSASVAGYVLPLPVAMRSNTPTPYALNLYTTAANGSAVVFTVYDQTLMLDPTRVYFRISGGSGLVAGASTLLLIGTTGVNGVLNFDAEL